MSSLFRAHRRVTAFLFALTLVAVSTKGLCLMPAARAVGASDAHACCAKASETIAPGCCMDGQADETAATMTMRVLLSALAEATVARATATAPAVPAMRIAFGPERRHSPPLRPILRV